jgi:hypothetical protein
MRLGTALICVVAVIMALALRAPDAEAQSFLQRIFGFGNPAQDAGPPAEPPARRRVLRPLRYKPHVLRNSRATPPQREETIVAPPDSEGPFRTVCVRMCDGFYFPLRDNAMHKDFAHDAQSCQSACGAEARLFYYSLRGLQSATELVDLAGRKYSDLSHAFLYRKRLIEGCGCKPEPWSAEAEARYKSYADTASLERANAKAYRNARSIADGDRFEKTKLATGARGIDASSSETGLASGTVSSRVSPSPEAGRRLVPTFRQRAAYEPISSSNGISGILSIFAKSTYVRPSEGH